MPRRICLATSVAASLFAGSGRSEAAPAPGLQCNANGPCRFPDSLDLVQDRAPNDLILASNFGLVLPATDGNGFQFVCEEVLGGRISDRTRVGPDGRAYVPGLDGLYVSSPDGCTWTRAAGILLGRSVFDVAIDPSTPGKLWAVGGDPRVLALSTDGGATMTAVQAFPSTLTFIRIALAPSNPRIMYLAGYGANVALVLAVSEDGGANFTIDENASAGVAGAREVVDLVGIAPDDPKTVYLSVTNVGGDQIWKSTAGGRAPVKILTLGEQGRQLGFTFGADASTIFVGGFDLLETVGKPPAYVYVSHDAGTTWDRHPSLATGPRYRCLHYRDGKLHACAGDTNIGDTFLVGESTDEGRTWTPLMTIADLKGVRSCVADRCATTTSWLCESYGICGGLNREGPPPRLDAAGGVVGVGGGRHGCTFAGAARPGGGGLFVLLAGLAGARSRRRKPRADAAGLAPAGLSVGKGGDPARGPISASP